MNRTIASLALLLLGCPSPPPPAAPAQSPPPTSAQLPQVPKSKAQMIAEAGNSQYAGQMVSLPTMAKLFPNFPPIQFNSNEAYYLVAVMNDALARFQVGTLPEVALFVGESSGETGCYETFCEYLCGGVANAVNKRCADNCCAQGSACAGGGCGSNQYSGCFTSEYAGGYSPYFGRGPIQVTFCSAYSDAQGRVAARKPPGWNGSLNFVEHPSLLSNTPWAFYGSASYFTQHGEQNCVSNPDPVGCATAINAGRSCPTGGCARGVTCGSPSSEWGGCLQCIKQNYFESAKAALAANPKQNAAPPAPTHVHFNNVALGSTPATLYVPCNGNSGQITINWESLSPVPLRGVANVPQSGIVTGLSIWQNDQLIIQSLVSSTGTSYRYPASFTL